MNLRGFIMEDDQGQEFVMMCQQPSTKSWTIFSLHGWQRRRLVPLHHTERELHQVVEGVLITLDDMLKAFPRPVKGADRASFYPTSSLIPRSSAPLLRSSKASQLRKENLKRGRR